MVEGTNRSNNDTQPLRWLDVDVNIRVVCIDKKSKNYGRSGSIQETHPLEQVFSVQFDDADALLHGCQPEHYSFEFSH
ncbi:MAG: hypothetical protein ACKKL5_03375 [Candidatus Komeilibacteria bacterium]